MEKNKTKTTTTTKEKEKKDINKSKNKYIKTKTKFILSRFGIILESAPRIAIFCPVTKTKGQTFRGIIDLFRPSCRREMQSFHYY